MRFLAILSILIVFSHQVLCDGEAGKSASSPVQDVSPSSSSTNGDEKPKMKVLELITGVGKALHMILNQQNLQNDTQLSTMKDNGIIQSNLTLEERNSQQKENYRRKAEELRRDIGKRASQLQQIVLAAIEVMKDRGDVMFRRVLEHVNSRLDQAKNSADKILKEPATSEMAIRTLNTINQGLNSITNHIQGLLNRVNIRINVDLKKENVDQVKSS